MRNRLFGILAIALLVAVPAAAADRVIDSGIDLWTTRGDGSTFADFSREPIPAGFFCNTSAPFTGRIAFRGVPVVTGSPGALGKTDTIVHRLDDAVFNRNGVAVTRVQVRAMTFESVAAIQTACGAFNVRVTLNGEQPITRMRILRDNAAGGRFLVPIAVNIKMVFTPVAGEARENLEIARSFVFAPNPNAQWAQRFDRRAVQTAAFVLVDTDGDRVADTYLPGTSNFAAGWPSRPDRQIRGKSIAGISDAIIAEPVCHLAETHAHCTTVSSEM